MTAATAVPARTSPVAAKHSGYLRSVRSEWIKAYSLRSTWILVGFALAAMVGLPTLFVRAGVTEGPVASVDALHFLFIGIDFALILVAVLGALLTTSEFTTGMSRNTFTATPGRGAVLAAKLTITAVLALGIGIVGLVGAWAANAGALADIDGSIDLGDAATMRVLWVYELGMVVFAVLAVGLGALLRSSVGAIFTIVAAHLILPVILASVPNDICNWIGTVMPPYALSQAASITGPAAGDIGLTPGVALVVLLLWGIVPAAAARLMLRVRDI